MPCGSKFEIEHWEAHLWHIQCGVWASRRCRVCAIHDRSKKIPEQWNQPPR